MKKLMAMLFALGLLVGTASAVDFSVGGKALGSVDLGNVGQKNAAAGLGAGVAAYAGIDFVDLNICKIGIRPEFLFYYSSVSILESGVTSGKGGFFAVRLPATFTFPIKENVALGAGTGVSWQDIEDFALAFDVFATIKAGPGKVITGISYDLPLTTKIHTVYLGVGYQYTF